MTRGALPSSDLTVDREPDPEEGEDLPERGVRRMAGLVDEVESQHRVRASREPMRVPGRGIDLHGDEAVAELSTQRVEPLARHGGIGGEPQPEHARAVCSAFLDACEVGVADADRRLAPATDGKRERRLAE